MNKPEDLTGSFPEMSAVSRHWKVKMNSLIHQIPPSLILLWDWDNTEVFEQ